MRGKVLVLMCECGERVGSFSAGRSAVDGEREEEKGQKGDDDLRSSARLERPIVGEDLEIAEFPGMQPSPPDVKMTLSTTYRGQRVILPGWGDNRHTPTPSVPHEGRRRSRVPRLRSFRILAP